MGKRNPGKELTWLDIDKMSAEISSYDPTYLARSGDVRRWLLKPTENIFSGILRDPAFGINAFINSYHPDSVEFTSETWFFVDLFMQCSLYLRIVKNVPKSDAPLITLSVPGIGSETTLLREPAKAFLGKRRWESMAASYLGEKLIQPERELLIEEEIECDVDRLNNFLSEDPYVIIRPRGRKRKLPLKRAALSIDRLAFKFPKNELSFVSFTDRGKSAGDFAVSFDFGGGRPYPPSLDSLRKFLGPVATGFHEFDLEGHYEMTFLK